MTVDISNLTCKFHSLPRPTDTLYVKHSPSGPFCEKNETKNPMILDTLTVPGIWTLVEMDMSIICSCLPTLPSLVRYWRDTMKSKSSKPGNGPTRASFLLPARKDKSTGYADLESVRVPHDSSSTQDTHASVKSVANNETYDMTPFGQVRVQRDFDVSY